MKILVRDERPASLFVAEILSGLHDCAVPALAAVLRNTDGPWTTRAEVAAALARIAGPSAVAILVEALSDPSADVRREVLGLLSELKDRRAVHSRRICAHGRRQCNRRRAPRGA